MRRTLILTPMLALAVALGGCDTLDPVTPAAEDTSADALDSLLAQASAAVSANGDDPAGDGGAAREADTARGDGRGDEGAGRGTPGLSLFDRLAAEIPGFGGIYRVQPCSIVVVLTSAADPQLAIRVVHAAVAPLVSRPCGDGIRVSAERGQYTYLELIRYLVASRPLFQLPGVHAVRIDYRANRLVYTVASREVAGSVLDALPRVGIPARAVTFELGGGLRS